MFKQAKLAVIAVIGVAGTTLRYWNVLPSRRVYAVGAAVSAAGLLVASLEAGQRGNETGLVIFTVGATLAIAVSYARVQHNPAPRRLMVAVRRMRNGPSPNLTCVSNALARLTDTPIGLWVGSREERPAPCEQEQELHRDLRRQVRQLLSLADAKRFETYGCGGGDGRNTGSPLPTPTNVISGREPRGMLSAGDPPAG